MVCAVGYDINDINDVFKENHGTRLVNLVNVVQPSFIRQATDECSMNFRRTKQLSDEF